jgi:hypothetical protein
MAKNHERYEKLVHQTFEFFAHEKLVKEHGAEILKTGYGHLNKIPGKSGFEHQIDVSIEYISQDGTHRLKLIECKNFSEYKIGLDTALTFFARMVDIP